MKTKMYVCIKMKKTKTSKIFFKSNKENIPELIANYTNIDISSNNFNLPTNNLFVVQNEISEKNENISPSRKLKEKTFINTEKYNHTNILTQMINHKYNKAFEALENLIKDETKDNSKNKKRHHTNHTHKSKNKKNKRNKSSIKLMCKSLNKEIISVPKLDFTNIFKTYKNKKLKIKEISIKPKHEKNTDDENAYINKKKLNDEKNRHHHHNHLHLHKKDKNRN